MVAMLANNANSGQYLFSQFTIPPLYCFLFSVCNSRTQAKSRFPGRAITLADEAQLSAQVLGMSFDDLIPHAQRETQAAPKQDINPLYDFFASMPGKFVQGLSGTLSASGQAAQTEMGQPVNVPSAEETNKIELLS